MEVKTENGGTFNAAGKGTTGLSIAGLVTGTAALLGNGLLGGLFGNNNNCCMQKNVMTKDLAESYAHYDALLSELQKEKSERYTDQSIIAYNKDKFDFNKDISNAIVEDRNRIARLEQYNESLKEIMALKEENLNQKYCCLEKDIKSAIALEAERRCNGDQNVFNYSKATYVPGKLIMPVDNICPSVMPEFNSWTAPTTTSA